MNEPTIVLIVSTGYSGANHTVDTKLSQQQWQALDEDSQTAMIEEAVWANIDCYPQLSDGSDLEET